MSTKDSIAREARHPQTSNLVDSTTVLWTGRIYKRNGEGIYADPLARLLDGNAGGAGRDACIVPYVCHPPRRLGSADVGAEGIEMSVCAVDVDGPAKHWRKANPGQELPPEMQAEQDAWIDRNFGVVDSLPEAGIPWPIFWLSRSGLRLLWLLEPGSCTPLNYNARCAAFLEQLRALGIEGVDQASAQWNRLQRLPFGEPADVPPELRRLVLPPAPEGTAPAREYTGTVDPDADADELLRRTKYGRKYLRAVELGTPGLVVYGTSDRLPNAVAVRSPFADLYSTPEKEDDYLILCDEVGNGGITSFHGNSDPENVGPHFDKLEELCPQLREEEDREADATLAALIMNDNATPGEDRGAVDIGFDDLRRVATNARGKQAPAIRNAIEALTSNRPMTPPMLRVAAKAIAESITTADAASVVAAMHRFEGGKGATVDMVPSPSKATELSHMGIQQAVLDLLEPLGVAFNELALRVEICGEPVTDAHLARLRLECEKRGIGGSRPVAKDVIQDCLLLAGHKNRFHPIREYLDALVWDGVDRNLASYLGEPEGIDEPTRFYRSQVCFAWMCSAVARIMKPGEQADAVLILEGEQGIYKSSALRVLAGDDWFYEVNSDPRDKDFAQDMAGKWIAEIPEIDHLIASRDESRMKRLITTRSDRYRASYGRFSEDHPRQVVFAGTTNRDDYLRDATGNRRFWPVECTKIDLDALRRDRDQLWAQAVAEYRQGKQWWLDAKVGAIAKVEQSKRLEVDVWDAAVAAWLEGRTERFAMAEAFEALPQELLPMSVSQSEQMRMGRALRRLGCSKAKSSRAFWEPPRPARDTSGE